jgi:hypothetical protein
MKPSMSNQNHIESQLRQPTCDCCREPHEEHRMPRREFLTVAGGAVLGASAIGSVLPAERVWAKVKSAAGPVANTTANSAPESLVKVLYESLSPKQRETVCFAWDYQDPTRGLLRTRVANNWEITRPFINGDFYTDDQRHIIRGIFDGIISPEWHARIDKQLGDDDLRHAGQRQVRVRDDGPAHDDSLRR